MGALALRRKPGATGVMDELTVKGVYAAERRAAERSEATRDGGEDRLEICGRARNDTQYLRGCGLPLQRLLGLVEQARVLDRDDGLIGEGAHEVDLLLREGPDFRAANRDAAQHLPMLEHRHRKIGARAA